MASPAAVSPVPPPPPLPLLPPSPDATAGAGRSSSASTSSASTSARNSMLLSSTSPAEKRLSTASNPSRNPPTPNQPPPGSSPTPSFSITASPAPSSPTTGKHRIPSFPPPQASRISVMSTLSSNRDSFHPQFTSSLPYTSVRDFAYPAIHQLHYGPSLPSGLSTPAGSQRGSQYFESGVGAGSWFTGGGSGYRRLSDPAHPSFDMTAAQASGGIGWGDSLSVARQRSTNQPPPLNFSDGPPWSEDEDLQSPVVMSKHRKHKSSAAHLQSGQHSRGQSKNGIIPTTPQHFAAGSRGDDWEGDRRSAIENGVAPGGDYYTTRAGRRTDLAGGEPGDELYNHAEGEEEYDPDDPQYYSHRAYSDEDGREYDDEDEGEDFGDEDSRFSRDYQFTIASPDEEMHGKAVALFDFIRENENELPLVEGQVVWVSYRHGMGWLVAEDPKTGESGLVPEEYVRLLRDLRPSYLESVGSGTMTPSSLTQLGSSASDLTLNTSNGNGGHNPPVISTFSTSSQDVHPYPYQFHYPTDHLPDNPHHIRAKSSPDLTGGETPTVGNHKERIAQLQREQERAVAEESATPRLRSGRFDESGHPYRRQDEAGDVGKGQNGLGIVAGSRGVDDVYYDAPERQGDGRSELDFRGAAGKERNLQVR